MWTSSHGQRQHCLAISFRQGSPGLDELRHMVREQLRAHPHAPTARLLSCPRTPDVYTKSPPASVSPMVSGRMLPANGSFLIATGMPHCWTCFSVMPHNAIL